jgi:hypothetical protein
MSVVVEQQQWWGLLVDGREATRAQPCLQRTWWLWATFHLFEPHTCAALCGIGCGRGAAAEAGEEGLVAGFRHSRGACFTAGNGNHLILRFPRCTRRSLSCASQSTAVKFKLWAGVSDFGARF